MNTCCNQIKRIIEDQKRFEREMMQHIAQIKTELANHRSLLNHEQLAKLASLG